MTPPSTQEVSDNIVAQLEASLAQTVPFLAKSFTRVIAKAFAGVFLIIYKYAGFSLLQMFVAHATDKPTMVNGKTIRPLVEWGRLVGVGDPIGATRAELTVSVPVQNQSGDLAAGSQLVRSASGVIYQVIAPVPLDAPTIAATIRASSDQAGGGGEGVIGNLSPGDVLEFANPLPNVAREVTVTAVAVTGANAESISAYRARIIRRFQRRPQGGAYADYQSWAEEVAGIANAYPYAGPPGEVHVYVEATQESSGSPDGIPTTAQLDAVRASIAFEADGRATRRPIGAAVTVLPITRVAFDVEIVGLEPDNSAMRDALELGLSEHLRSREPFIVGLSVLPREDRITQAALSGIADTIVNAEGGTITRLELLPGPAYTLGPGEKAKLGTPTYS